MEDIKSSISDWQSIFTLCVFLLTNIVVIFPFSFPVPYPFPISAYPSSIKDVLPTDKPRIQAPNVDDKSSSVLEIAEGDTTLAQQNSFNPRQNPFASLKFEIRYVYIPVNHLTAPFFSVILLLCTKCINGTVVRQGIVGSDGIKPLDIMALFISLAYMSISLDTLGLFRFLAFWVARKGGSSGRLLYLMLYALFFVLSALFGNDVVILSGTPFLGYFTRILGIESPHAWTFAQFAVANMASALLPPANPTNLVLTGAFSIPFLSYAAHTVLPVLAAAVAVFPFLLMVQFRNRKGGARGPGKVWIPKVVDVRGLGAGQEEIELESQERQLGSDDLNQRLSTQHITPPKAEEPLELDVKEQLVDLQSLHSNHSVPPIMPFPPTSSSISPAAVSVVHRNTSTTSNSFVPSNPNSEITEFPTDISSPRTAVVPAPTLPHPKSTIFGAFLLLATLCVLLGVSTLNVPVWEVTVPPAIIMLLRDVWSDVRTVVFSSKPDPFPPVEQTKDTEKQSVHASHSPFAESEVSPPPTTKSHSKTSSWLPRAKHIITHPSTSFPTITHILPRLPLSLIPFSFCMFILVQSLASKGWVDVFAHWWRAWTELCLRGGEAVGVLGAVVGMMVVGVLMCNICGTNIGATILLARVIQAWLNTSSSSHTTQIPKRLQLSAIYSLAIASNFGAFSFCFSASLAGLLWRSILLQKQILLSQARFAYMNTPIILLAAGVAAGVLIAEVIVVPR